MKNNHWLRNPSHPQSYRWYGIPAGRLYPRPTGPGRAGEALRENMVTKYADFNQHHFDKIRLFAVSYGFQEVCHGAGDLVNRMYSKISA